VDNGKPIRETLIADLLPPGVLNIVNGYGREAGMPLVTSKRIAKIAFTGSTATGRVIAQAAASNLIPATLELGGKSPNIFFEDIMAADDAFFDKAIKQGSPLDTDTMMGAQASAMQMDKILSYLEVGKAEGAEVLIGGHRAEMGGKLAGGRVWTNCYHAYPAHAAFGGYKESGIGRETHKAMLDHYQQTKNLLVSYSPNALGVF
jgi:acyl-CoA reductase-like NAD-dependent aldehyde dehydrogenase